MDPNEQMNDDVFDIDNIPDEDGGKSKFWVKPGSYRAKCIDVNRAKSKAGNDMLVWEFVLVDGGEAEGKEFKVWTALTSAAMWKVGEVLRALGVACEDGKARFKKPEVVGKECMVEIEDDEYNGRINSKIATCAPLAA